LLTKLCVLFSLWCIQQDLGIFFEGGYFKPEQSKMLKKKYLSLCKEVADESVSVIDAIALPDEVMASVFGRSDGLIYQNFWKKIREQDGHDARPPYWEMLRTPVQFQTRQMAKL